MIASRMLTFRLVRLLRLDWMGGRNAVGFGANLSLLGMVRLPLLLARLAVAAA